MAAKTAPNNNNPYRVEGRRPNFWINPDTRKSVDWKDGDVVVSVPSKSGTTWTMNIVHQLREGGDPNFEDLYKEVPWLEFAMPYQTTEEILKEISEMPTSRRRVFKTHGTPGSITYFEPKEGNPAVKYVCTFRNPEEACVSFYPFLASHNRDVIGFYDIPRHGFTSFDDYLEKFYFGRGKCQEYFQFVKDWWPHRHSKNVVFLHFSNMKKDHEGSIQKVSDFLGYDYTPEQFSSILEYTSFPWMKEHQHKFEMPNFFKEGPFLKSGSMVRNGKTGQANKEGMTEELAAKIRAVGVEVLGEDHPGLEWFYKGGPLPE